MMAHATAAGIPATQEPAAAEQFQLFAGLLHCLLR
jgi:hypothetical protein